MTQQELEALLAQIAPNGQTARLEFTEQTVIKKVKRKVPAASEFGQPTEEEVEVRVPTRTWIDRGTGRTVTVEVNSDGTYTKTYDGTDPKNQGAPAGPKPGEAKPRQTRVNPSDETRIQEFDPDANGGQGAWVDGGTNAAGVRSAAAANKPTVTIREDGNGNLVAITTYPDGRAPTTAPVSGVAGKPPTLTHDGTVYERQPDGTYKPAAGIPTPGAGLKNVEPFTPDYSQPDLGLGQWAAAQRSKIGLPPEAGGITQKDYDNAVTAAHQQAQVTIQNVTSNQQVVRQRGIDEQGQRNTLSEQGRSDFDAARRVYDSTWQYANPNSNNRFSTIPYLMSEISNARKAREGTATPLSPLHPMFTGLAQQAGVNAPSLADRRPPPITEPTPPSGAEVAAQANAVIPQTVSNLGALATPPPAVPAIPAPAVAPTVAPAGVPGNTSSANNVGVSPIQPTVQPVLSTPENGLPPGLPIPPTGTLPAPPAPNQTPVPIPYPDNAGAQSKLMGAPLTAWASGATAQPSQVVYDGNGMLNPALQATQQQAQQPMFDPYQSAGKLSSMGVPQEAILQAMRELGFVKGGM